MKISWIYSQEIVQIKLTSICKCNRTHCETKVLKTARKWPIQFKNIYSGTLLRRSRVQVLRRYFFCVVHLICAYFLVPCDREGLTSLTEENFWTNGGGHNETELAACTCREFWSMFSTGRPDMDQLLTNLFPASRRLKKIHGKGN